MVKGADIARLEKVARLKAEIELKRFAAFSAHVTAARDRIDGLQVALMQSYQSAAPLTVPEARMANAQAARSAREITRAEAELARMMPRFNAARAAAAREFGRAAVLDDLSAQALAEIRSKRG